MNRESIHPYTLPLVGGTLRAGALVRLVGSDGSVGWGDAAPLEGWSSETLDDVLALKDVPSLRCAREAADVALAGLVDWPVMMPRVPINALLDGDAAAMSERAREAADAGCVCFKVKVAGLGADQLRRLLDGVCKVAGGGARFRLDPNRSWAFDVALEIAGALRGYPVEYIEEPLAEAERLPRFIQESPLPVALDETLREIEPEGLASFRGAVALVLKPTLMGGFQRVREFARAGEKHGMVSVVSACFESGVGIYALGRFAASLAKTSAAGLDTYSRLGADVLASRLRFDGFVFDPMVSMPPIDRDVVAI